MRSELNPIKTGLLTLPGAHQMTIVGIRWAGEPTEEEFNQTRALSAVIKRVDAWIEGDVLAKYIQREQHKRPGMTVKTLVGEYALGEGDQHDQCYERYCVASYFKWSERFKDLDWSLHRIVWGAKLGSKAEALAWLEKAQTSHWTARDLRAALASAKQLDAGASEPQIPALFPMELQVSIDWLSGRLNEVDALTPEQAASRYRETELWHEYRERLRARAGEILEVKV